MCHDPLGPNQRRASGGSGRAGRLSSPSALSFHDDYKAHIPKTTHLGNRKAFCCGSVAGNWPGRTDSDRGGRHHAGYRAGVLAAGASAVAVSAAIFRADDPAARVPRSGLPRWGRTVWERSQTESSDLSVSYAIEGNGLNKGRRVGLRCAEMASWQVGGVCSSSAQDFSGKRLENGSQEMARLKIAKHSR